MRGPHTRGTLYCFPRCVSKELEEKQSSWNVNRCLHGMLALQVGTSPRVPHPRDPSPRDPWWSLKPEAPMDPDKTFLQLSGCFGHSLHLAAVLSLGVARWNATSHSCQLKPGQYSFTLIGSRAQPSSEPIVFLTCETGHAIPCTSVL